MWPERTHISFNLAPSSVDLGFDLYACARTCAAHIRDPNISAPEYQPVYAFEVKGTMRTLFRTVTHGCAQMITDVDYFNAFFSGLF